MPVAVAASGGLTSLDGAAAAPADADADPDADADAVEVGVPDGVADALVDADGVAAPGRGAVLAPDPGFFVGVLVAGFVVGVGLGFGEEVVRFAGATPG